MNIKDWAEVQELMGLRERLVGIRKSPCIVIHADGHNKKEFNICMNGEWANCDAERKPEVDKIHGSMLRCFDSVKIDIQVWIEEIESKLRKLGVRIDRDKLAEIPNE